MSDQVQQAEVKHVQSKLADKQASKRDPNLAEGEKMQTPKEREAQSNERKAPQEPPIIQKDVT